jgi:transcriptional regulator with XRE-family HTH domain
MYNPSNRVGYMTLGERLKLAMEYAGLHQKALEAASGVKQQIIHKIVSGKQLTSAHTVKLAIACGVRPEWLAEEQGVMVDGYTIADQRLVHLVKVCEALPDYAVDQLVQQCDAMAKLAAEGGRH